MKQWIKKWDLKIIHKIQECQPKDINNPSREIKFWKLVSDLISPIFIIIVFTLLILVTLSIKEFVREMIWLIVCFLPAIATYQLKKLFKRDRIDTDHIKRWVWETSKSFPSSHATTAIVLLGFVAYLVSYNYFLILLSYLSVILVALICYSRMIMGVHYPSDILGGIGFGWLNLWLITSGYQLIPSYYFESWVLLGLLVVGWLFVIKYYKKYPKELPEYLRQRSELFQRALTAIIFLSIVIVPIIKGGSAFSFLIYLLGIEATREIFTINIKKDRSYLRVSAFIILTLYIYSFYSLRQLDFGLWTLLYVIVIVSLADIAGWFVGKKATFLPDRKILPKISPGKTWRGTIGSFIIPTILLIPVAIHYQQPLLILLTFTLTIAAFFGDILASYYKRQFDAKDFPEILPGHGGLLDRIDSQLLVITILYLTIRIFHI